MSDEHRIFIWTVNGIPQTGDLVQYAHMKKFMLYGDDVVVPDTVLTWDGTDTPLVWKVKVERGQVTESDYIPYTISVPGLPGEAIVWIDGRA